MVRNRTSNPNNTDASSDEMVSLRQTDPPRIHNDSGGRSINMVYRIIFLGTAVALVVLWGSKFVAHKHEQQQRYQLRIKHDASGDDHMDELDSLEQEQELELEFAEREKAAKDKEKELAKREKAAKAKEDELAKREKEVASAAAAASSSSSASAEKKEGRGKGNKNQEKSKTKPSTNTGSSWEDAAWERMNSIKREQVENYRSQQALMLNIHATHHGGTAFCGRIGRNGINETIAPAFACMGDRDNVMPDPPDCRVGKAKSHTAGVDPEFCYSYREMTSMHKGQMPWAKEQTGPFIDAIRPYFHLISWEFAGPVENRKDHSMDDPDYEHPNLVSVLVTREPISRLLAGDGIIGKKYPGHKTQELNRTRWWDYAAYDGQKESDNFFLRILTGAKQPKRKKSNATNHITKGIDRSTNDIMELFPTGLHESHFEHGKSLMDRFTFVLDVACFDAGMQAMGNLLEMGLPPLKTPSKSTIKARSGTKALSPKERIGYDDVYEYLVAKNEWDIKLYEYSKTISLIDCDELDEVP